MSKPALATHRKSPDRKRHKNFEETHRELVEMAVRLISEQGVNAVSIAALARATGINRTTVYYHFESREALLDAVKAWSSEQIALAFERDAPQQEKIDFITRFVLENPELIKLWIDDFLSPGKIGERYTHWDDLVAAVRKATDGDDVDAEVYCVNLLTSAIIGPRVFRNSVDGAASTDRIVARFRKERQRLLKSVALYRDEPPKR